MNGMEGEKGGSAGKKRRGGHYTYIPRYDRGRVVNIIFLAE